MHRTTLSGEKQYEAVRLYRYGLSAQQVAERLTVGIDAVYYLLRRLKISRRTTRESNRLRFEATPLSYQLKTELTLADEKLKLAGVMLYWAEGYKVGRQNTIDFANSDPAMIVLFKKFLDEICGVNKKKIRCHLYCYQGQDTSSLTRFWSRLLTIPETQFSKPYINTKSAPGPRGPRMVHGTLHLCYSDTRLLRQILSWIGEYSKT
jgi:hypothetical protein